MKRDEAGRFAKDAGMYIDDKGYWQYSAGPNRSKRVHRVKMEERIGRPLRRDEHVHHRDGNKLNFEDSNLELMDERTHNAVSAKQYWFLKTYIWPKEKAAWNDFHGGGQIRP